MTCNEASTGVFDRLPPYYVKENFFEATLVDRLLEHVSENRERFEVSKIRSIEGGRRIDQEIRISSVLRDFGVLKEEIKANFQAIFLEALEHLGMQKFELCGTEREIVAHGNGAFYNRHIDTATGAVASSLRVLSAVYYFHAQPRKFQGGQLRLLPLRATDLKNNYLDIEPIHNRVLLFPSWLPHQVMPVVSSSGEFNDSRFSINCWYHKLKSQRQSTSENAL